MTSAHNAYIVAQQVKNEKNKHGFVSFLETLAEELIGGARQRAPTFVTQEKEQKETESIGCQATTTPRYCNF